MKTFEVGQRVFKLAITGEIDGGEVISFSPTGASMRVAWGPLKTIYAYTRLERGALLTVEEAEKEVERRSQQQAYRVAKSNYEAAVRHLGHALLERSTTPETWRSVTEQIRAITESLGKVQS